VLVAKVAVLFDRLEDHAFQLFRQLRPDFAGRPRLLVENRRSDDGTRRACECRSSGRHLVEHQPEREQVGPRVNVFTAQLLGRHVRNRADDASSVRQGRGRHRGLHRRGRGPLHRGFRQPKVEDFRTPRGEKNVRRLDVAVHDPFGVRGFQGIGQPGSDVEEGWNL
jgi:hypothetical protein